MRKVNTQKQPDRPVYYSDDFKMKIIQEYLETDLTKNEILAKYGVKAKSPIQKWMRKFGIVDPYAKKDYLDITNYIELKKRQNIPAELEVENLVLAKRIRELEIQVKEEKLKAEMFARIIEIAENDYNLNIRKKPDTK